jgi:kanamycin nucleotidyltransferase
MRTALCLLNCTHVNHDYFEGIRETFKFKRLPKRYPVLATRMWNTKDPLCIAKDSRELLRNYLSLLKSEKII